MWCRTSFVTKWICLDNQLCERKTIIHACYLLELKVRDQQEYTWRIPNTGIPNSHTVHLLLCQMRPSKHRLSFYFLEPEYHAKCDRRIATGIPNTEYWNTELTHSTFAAMPNATAKTPFFSRASLSAPPTHLYILIFYSNHPYCMIFQSWISRVTLCKYWVGRCQAFFYIQVTYALQCQIISSHS